MIKILDKTNKVVEVVSTVVAAHKVIDYLTVHELDNAPYRASN